MTTRWQRIAREGAGEDYAVRYAERFRALAARGEDVHGEAALVTALAPAPARVLDAGCGTGRIAIRLHELGYDVVGVDVDASMLDQARAAAPDLDWRLADLATLDLGPGLRRGFDLVLCAGNTLPLLEPGTLEAACRRLADHAAADGVVVCGFGTDEDHLPGDCPVTPLADVDAAFARAGLRVRSRFGTWDRAPHDPADGYAVTVYGGAP